MADDLTEREKVDNFVHWLIAQPLFKKNADRRYINGEEQQPITYYPHRRQFWILWKSNRACPAFIRSIKAYDPEWIGNVWQGEYDIDIYLR